MEFEESSQDTVIGAKSLLSDLRTIKQEPSSSSNKKCSQQPLSDTKYLHTASIKGELMDTTESPVTQFVSYSAVDHPTDMKTQVFNLADVIDSGGAFSAGASGAFSASATNATPEVASLDVTSQFEMTSLSEASQYLDNIDHMTSQSGVANHNQFALIDSEGGHGHIASSTSTTMEFVNNDDGTAIETATSAGAVPIQVITQPDGSVQLISGGGESNLSSFQIVNDPMGMMLQGGVGGVNVVSADEVANSALVLQDLVNSSS